jgi:hypothetical protein
VKPRSKVGANPLKKHAIESFTTTETALKPRLQEVSGFNRVSLQLKPTNSCFSHSLQGRFHFFTGRADHFDLFGGLP